MIPRDLLFLFCYRDAEQVNYTTPRHEYYTNSSGETETQVVYDHHIADDHENNCTVKLTVAEFPDGFVAQAPPAYDGDGHYYQFPFQLTLPRTVPAGVVIENGNDRAEIVHSMFVEVKHGDDPDHCKSYKVCRTTVLVLSRNNKPVSTQFTKDTKDVMFCCCFPRGTIALGAKLDKAAYWAGENFTFQAYATNNSTVKNKDFRPKMIVTEHISFMAMGHHSYTSLRLGSQKCIGVPSTEADVQQNLFQFPLPHSTHSTSQSKLVCIWHEAEFTVDTPCCIDNLSVHLPMVVNASCRQTTPASVQPPPPPAAARKTKEGEEDPRVRISGVPQAGQAGLQEC